MTETVQHAILVVDDDEPIVKNMRRILKRKGFTRVISALNGEQGIKLLEDTRNHFFLIMSDQRMPGMSGFEFLEKSILLSPESRRMLVTGYSDYDAIVAAVNRGEIHQYISKPWNNEDLLLKIQAEHEIFNNFQMRKRLYNLTRHQNAKLFDVASKQKQNLDIFTRQLEDKKTEIDDLVQALSEAKAAAEYKEVFLGLDELLSRTITMNQKNLVQAFAISRNGIRETLATIAERNRVDFTPAPGIPAVDQDLSETTFEIIDQIIENVVQALEPKLFGIGSEPDTGKRIDDYTEVPDFGVLAFNDGYITRGELEIAQEELEERESAQSTGLTIDKVLIEKKYLRRKDLSRLFAKLALIETRLLDREFADILLQKEIINKKDTERAFKKQLNTFEDSGVSMLLGDILVESDVISPELRDETIAGQDRSGKKKGEAVSDNAFSAEFGAFVDLQVSEDRVQAWIRVPKTVQGTTDVAPVKALVKKRGITNGVVKDAAIREFIKNCTDPHEKFVVAQGTPASVGKPADITYHFNTEHDSAGVVREDGSIDFTARGDSPYVKKGELLAEKHPMEYPKPGMDIFGETLLVGEVDDVPLLGGEGIRFSEDELKIYSEIAGQPSLDVKGVVSVLEQFTVKGDVDFKTGNINFSGNVLVTGTVKEGFTVECDDLIANEVNGATIITRGDLKVSNGIVNARVETQGSIQAKFLNNVRLFGHGNLMITREIMGSRVLISGAVNNEAGRITDSLIAARLGLSVKQIGTEKAAESVIKAGSDDHILWISRHYDDRIATISQDLDRRITRKHELDDTHNDLHVDVANQTFAQEKLNKKMEYIETMMAKAGSKEERLNLSKEMKELEEAVDQADERIKKIFEQQDAVMQEINACEQEIQGYNQKIDALEKERDTILTRLTREDATPLLKINKKAFRGTKIMGTEASYILSTEVGAGKFTEVDTGNPEAPKQITHQPINI
ncbi:MAG: FapA family protein [Desulfobacterales bacterium]|nr:FapA family protein [Desulfobacterales bacterium]